MPEEKIEVRYKKVAGGAAYHKYIIYTDENGDQQIARGGPENGDGYDDRGGADNSLPGTFGRVVTEVKPYVDDPTTPDWVDPQGDPDPSEIIISGEDLSEYWEAIVENMDSLNDFHYQYQPMGQNSNSTIDDVLERSGLPPATLDDSLWSPGSDRPFELFYIDPWPTTPSDYPQDVTSLLGDAANSWSPLVLDLDGDGIELATMNETGSVYWDIDQDGFSEAAGWITGGDGLLAIDLNEDGFINDQSELFGNQSGSPNGFSSLATYDSNTDGYITSADTQFGDLLVWVDANADGYSQDTELYTLTELSITSINLGYSNVNYSIAGNQILQESTFTMNSNTRTIVDAWFAYDNVNTVYTEDYTLDERTLFLPTLRGYGQLPSLHIAMSLDETLLEMVQDFVTDYDLSEMMGFAADPFSGPIQDIMFKWAGVDEVVPDSRGDYIDARVLEFLEALTGEDFIHTNGGYSPDPGPAAGPFIWQAWATAYEAIAARLIHQAQNLSDIFGDDLSYNPITDTFEGVSSLDLEVIEERIFASEEWINQAHVARFLVSLIAEAIGIENLSEPDYDDLQLLMPEGLTIEMLEDAIIGAGAINGDGEDNLIIAGYDSGISSGYDGDDVLIGGSGADTIYGGGGNDTYVWNTGDGNDVLSDSAGTDVLRFGEGITADDLRFAIGTSYALEIYIGSEKITISDQLYDDAYSSNYIDEIETAVFSDTSTLSLVNNLNFTGTSSSETVYGLNDNNTLKGLEGDDTLYGYTGNDTYIWSLGDGNDTISDSAGTDKLQFGEGITADDLRFVFGSYNSLEIYIGSEKITISDQLYDVTYGTSYIDEVETALFADTSTLSLVNNLTFTGTSSGETVYGVGDNNTLKGLAGADTLYAYNGNDVLYGGSGVDTLDGGSGADTFAWLAGDIDGSLDTISDFTVGDDDSIDISDVLDDAGYNPLSDLLTDYVKITEDYSSTTFWIDVTGTGTFGSDTDFVVLSGVMNILPGGSSSVSTGTDLQNLINAGTLVV